MINAIIKNISVVHRTPEEPKDGTRPKPKTKTTDSKPRPSPRPMTQIAHVHGTKQIKCACQTLGIRFHSAHGTQQIM